MALPAVAAWLRRVRSQLRRLRCWLYNRERYLWLQAELPVLPEPCSLPPEVRVFPFEQRWAFLQALPPELALRLTRLWEVLPQSWAFAHAAEGAAVAYYCFVSTGVVWIDEFGMERVFTAQEAYVHSCYTLPSYRGQGLHSRTLQAVCCWLAQRGVRRAFAVVAHRNVPSLRGFQRAGFVVAGSIEHRCLFGRLRRLRAGIPAGEAER